MSLYNLMFGVNPVTPVLIATLGIKPSDIPMFRDCFLGENEIVIYTRTGGGNREYYDEVNEDNLEGPWNSTLVSNQYYLRDTDDDFDSTYAYFYFKFPAEYTDDLVALATASESFTPSDKWKMLLASFESAK